MASASAPLKSRTVYLFGSENGASCILAPKTFFNASSIALSLEKPDGSNPNIFPSWS